jgi:hypothetical protein
MDYAGEFPQFVPPMFSLAELNKAKVNIEVLRDIQVFSDQISRLVADGLLIYGNQAFNQTLMYYNSVRELSRRNVPGARELFERLNLLFRRGRRTDEEPTENEVEKDVKALLHGKKDGEIVIKNERPHMVGGKHEVIDSIHSGHTAVKEVIEAEE